MNWVNRMFLFVKKYGKWRGKLISEYVLLTIFVVCIVAISFFATVHIVNSSAMEQSRQSLDVIFQQAEERIKILEDDIESLHLNVIHNDSIVEFFRAKNVAERWDNLSGFYQVVGNNRRLNRNLQNVVLYDTAGNLIASKGDVYLPRAEEIARKGMYLYSTVCWIPGREKFISRWGCRYSRKTEETQTGHQRARHFHGGGYLE